MTCWSVVHTRPHQEARAETNLVRQGYKAWLPYIERSRRKGQKFLKTLEPMFPGYLFVELDPDKNTWSTINNTYGVKYLLTNSSRPNQLPKEFVAALIKTVRADGKCMPVFGDIKRGDKVKFVSGPFVDCLANVLDLLPGERVRLLMNVLGSKIVTSASRKALTASV